ncbi:hypothetical protein K7432_002777 [Basidiobolus ranarum]|uniref:Uncharacterized protein n=1 Tax=Basidiobolus ranarum TaxID=34480 RepID=A0ABR2W799_9FUNG
MGYSDWFAALHTNIPLLNEHYIRSDSVPLCLLVYTMILQLILFTLPLLGQIQCDAVLEIENIGIASFEAKNGDCYKVDFPIISAYTNDPDHIKFELFSDERCKKPLAMVNAKNPRIEFLPAKFVRTIKFT